MSGFFSIVWNLVECFFIAVHGSIDPTRHLTEGIDMDYLRLVFKPTFETLQIGQVLRIVDPSTLTTRYAEFHIVNSGKIVADIVGIGFELYTLVKIIDKIIVE